jgi:hypothetical protein
VSMDGGRVCLCVLRGDASVWWQRCFFAGLRLRSCVGLRLRCWRTSRRFGVFMCLLVFVGPLIQSLHRRLSSIQIAFEPHLQKIETLSVLFTCFNLCLFTDSLPHRLQSRKRDPPTGRGGFGGAIRAAGAARKGRGGAAPRGGTLMDDCIAGCFAAYFVWVWDIGFAIPGNACCGLWALM